jgi:DNA modification methylase
MYNAARQVFRVLKPGALYLFNIFDYFDNENTLALSAMGQKRMVLGAYIVNIFRRVGFQLDGNVVWYKGEIEGKRNFNQGNRSPYYQFPFNCWEHVFVFRKPGRPNVRKQFPSVLATKPVIKMVRGENVLGHSAPFPAAIPDLLLSQMKAGERVLDPFSGSMTTGRQALKRGLQTVSIELHEEYCELGLRLLRQEGADSPLFRWAENGVATHAAS